MSAQALEEFIPELDWRHVEKSKKGANHFYFFKFNKRLKGFAYCYPEEIVKTMEEIEDDPYCNRDSPKRGKYTVELICKIDGEVKRLNFEDSIGSRKGKNDVALAVKGALLGFSTIICKALPDDEKKRYKTLLNELRQREMKQGIYNA